MPSARAGAEDTDLAIVARLRPHPFHSGFSVAHDLRVRHAALSAHFRCDIVRIALAIALVEVRADGEIAVVRELARHLDVELAPPRKMMHEHDAGKRPRPRWARCVGRNLVAFVALELDELHGHAAVWHSASSLLWLSRLMARADVSLPSARTPAHPPNARLR